MSATTFGHPDSESERDESERETSSRSTEVRAEPAHDMMMTGVLADLAGVLASWQWIAYTVVKPQGWLTGVTPPTRGRLRGLN